MTASQQADGPVALVVHRRIADEGFAAFARWNGKVEEQLKAWPDSLARKWCRRDRQPIWTGS